MTEFPNKKTDFRYFNDGFEIDKDGFSNNNSQFYFFRGLHLSVWCPLQSPTEYSSAKKRLKPSFLDQNLQYDS